MKQTFFALGFCIIAGPAFTQNQPGNPQPDSIHVVLHENQNGTILTLDTIVPVSQQQSLFTWMEANGWQAPPPPPPPGHPHSIEHVIVMEGDSGLPHGQRHVMIVKGSCDSMPQGAHMRMKHPGQPGEMIVIHPPMPPHPPGSQVAVDVEHKDTIIDGKQHKMIVRTERIILPEGVTAPPAPPVAPMPPTPGTPPQGDRKPAPAEHQKQLVVFPNPSTGVINVEFDVNPREKTTLRVLDMNGKVVYTEEITMSGSKHVKREINLGAQGKGTYTVEVKSSKQVMTERVIIQ